jgi:hypothetical protein
MNLFGTIVPEDRGNTADARKDSFVEDVGADVFPPKT